MKQIAKLASHNYLLNRALFVYDLNICITRVHIIGTKFQCFFYFTFFFAFSFTWSFARDVERKYRTIESEQKRIRLIVAIGTVFVLSLSDRDGRVIFNTP